MRRKERDQRDGRDGKEKHDKIFIHLYIQNNQIIQTSSEMSLKRVKTLKGFITS